ncbi:MAG: TetR/AcrR family transcriptional regulator [Gammaproteobacteria bacterium]|nr:TetR/AcrR family transcriptional regulator [Gammaproteobacteria bacterium]
MNLPRPVASDATRTRILDVAERLVQTRGFNGFSYADIAAELGITKASLHYHFATKADLGCTLVVRYTEGFAAALRAISDAAADAPAQLRAYVKLYSDVLAERRLCLCGMVAAEYGTLPAPMQAALRVFFGVNESWLSRLLEEGSRDGSLDLRVAPLEAARMLVGALEGAMLVARAYGDPERFTGAADLLVRQLEREDPAARARASARTAPHPLPQPARLASGARASGVRASGRQRARPR